MFWQADKLDLVAIFYYISDFLLLSPEDLIYLLDLKPGGKRYEITTWVAKRTACSDKFKGFKQ